MNLTINFNWPTGQDSASVEMGQPSLNDAQTEFRIGVVPKEHENKIAWHTSGWTLGDKEFNRITFGVRRGDKVVVERRKQGAEKIETRNEWDVSEEWPPEAYGPAMTVVPWHF